MKFTNLTKEQAVELHRRMWQDMLDSLGPDPTMERRITYKEQWIKKHFPNDAPFLHDCVLCEYGATSAILHCRNPIFVVSNHVYCEFCPIVWNKKSWHGAYACESSDTTHWDEAPLADIIALPTYDELEEEKG